MFDRGETLTSAACTLPLTAFEESAIAASTTTLMLS